PVGQSPLVTKPVPVLTTDRVHTNETSDFSAILCALDPNCFMITAHSPVDIELTGPDGRSMTRDFAAIPGASYMELEDGTGHPIAVILVPFPLGGEYAITVRPKPRAT